MEESEARGLDESGKELLLEMESEIQRGEQPKWEEKQALVNMIRCCVHTIAHMSLKAAVKMV